MGLIMTPNIHYGNISPEPEISECLSTKYNKTLFYPMKRNESMAECCNKEYKHIINTLEERPENITDNIEYYVFGLFKGKLLTLTIKHFSEVI